MKQKLLLLMMIVFSTIAFNANAQTHRLQGENKRIRHGARSGALTRPETKRLRNEEKHLMKEGKRFKTNDGQISAAEKRKLRRDKRKLDRDIRRQAHDAQQH